MVIYLIRTGYKYSLFCLIFLYRNYSIFEIILCKPAVLKAIAKNKMKT